MEIFTQNARETQKLGEEIGHNLIKGEIGSEEAFILTLYGELGSGKTTFTQGLAKGLGIPRRLVSPTFIIVKEYQINLGKFRKFIHIDLYRTETKADLAGLGLDEIFNNQSNVVAIEWPEKLGDNLPQERMEIRFRQIDENKRKIDINAKFKNQNAK